MLALQSLKCLMKVVNDSFQILTVIHPKDRLLLSEQTNTIQTGLADTRAITRSIIIPPQGVDSFMNSKYNFYMSKKQ